MALEAAREGGKPLIDSLVEADRAVDSIRLCVEHLRSQAGEEIPMGRTASSGGRLAFTQFEPIGPVLAFSAFNHPLNLIAHQVGPALAAGCPVVVKPAKATPLSCFRLVQILREAGLPDEWCQPLVTVDLDVANQMVADPRVAFFTFIGSGEVGWRLRRQLAAGARCSLEHGGVAPVIVAADADLDYAVPLLVKGGFYHAGQVCVSVQRIFADRRIAQALADRIAASAQRLKVGDPTRLETEVGPLIRGEEVTRLDQWVREVVEAGAGLLCGGRVLPNNCYAPTVLFDPPAAARVMRHEVFGPVVLRIAVRRPGRSHPAGQFPALRLPGGRLHPRSRYGPAGCRGAGRLGRDGQRPHGLSRRLDAVCRAAAVGTRRRRDPAHDGRNAGEEDDCHPLEGAVEEVLRQPITILRKSAFWRLYSASSVTPLEMIARLCLT